MNYNDSLKSFYALFLTVLCPPYLFQLVSLFVIVTLTLTKLLVKLSTVYGNILVTVFQSPICYTLIGRL